MDTARNTFIEIRPLLQELLERLVSSPEALRVEVTETATSVYVEIRAADHDVGQLLGRGGTHARALETLFRAILGKSDRYFTLHVVTASSARAPRTARRV